jgi:hypothetical protein
MRRRKRVRVGGGHGEGGVGERGMWQDVPIRPDMPRTSRMTSMFNVGGTSPTTSRREERMEPYTTPQDVADLGSSSGAGTKRSRSLRMNMCPTSSSSQSYQNPYVLVPIGYKSIVHSTSMCLQS